MEKRVPVVSRKSTYRNVSSASQNCGDATTRLKVKRESGGPDGKDERRVSAKEAWSLSASA